MQAKKINILAMTLLLLVSTACSIGDTAEPASEASPSKSAGPTLLGELDFELLPEASGMTVSRRDPNRLWIINDQGNPAELIAVDTKTMNHTVIKVRGARNRDWEELAAFDIDGQAWLLIADVGDNKAVRDNVRLIFVKEPDVSLASKKVDSQSVRMTYPGGARDVEAVAVDATRDAIYFLSKRTKPPVLYSLPLREAMLQAASGTKASLRPTKLGDVLSIPEPTAFELKLFPKYGMYRNQPTAMDVSPDGSQIALLTYGEAYLISLGPEQSWLDAMNTSPQPIGMPILAQPETIAFDSDNNVYLSTERQSAPVLRFDAKNLKGTQ